MEMSNETRMPVEIVLNVHGTMREMIKGMNRCRISIPYKFYITQITRIKLIW
jgi:hypothetical protein